MTDAALQRMADNLLPEPERPTRPVVTIRPSALPTAESTAARYRELLDACNDLPWRMVQAMRDAAVDVNAGPQLARLEEALRVLNSRHVED